MIFKKLLFLFIIVLIFFFLIIFGEYAFAENKFLGKEILKNDNYINFDKTIYKYCIDGYLFYYINNSQNPLIQIFETTTHNGRDSISIPVKCSNK